VKPRLTYDPDRLDVAGKRYGSYYILRDTKTLLSEGGYSSFPLPVARYDLTAEEVYARGPAMMALPAIKTLNDEKKLLLKQGHRALDAPLLMHDDGIASFSMKAGAMNPNTVSADGKPLVIPMPASNVQVGLELMAVEDADIDSAFLVDLFKLLLDDPKVFSATQVVEMAAQKGILIAPTIGGQQSGYLGPMIDREIDLAAEMGLLLPMPPQLVEARGEYEVVYTSPLSRAAVCLGPRDDWLGVHVHRFAPIL
jgi:hypothetical protein